MNFFIIFHPRNLGSLPEFYKPYNFIHFMNSLVWLDLNSSYAHSSLALPAIHAQVKGDEGFGDD